MLKAGLKGIRENYQLRDPSEEDVFEYDETRLLEKQIDKLPASLSEALVYYHKSDLVKEALGEHMFSEYYRAKYQEWNEFRMAVTDWELKKYLEVL
jgi:glutamine synthetase